jgi:hypothetical protein
MPVFIGLKLYLTLNVKSVLTKKTLGWPALVAVRYLFEIPDCVCLNVVSPRLLALKTRRLVGSIQMIANALWQRIGAFPPARVAVSAWLMLDEH